MVEKKFIKIFSDTFFSCDHFGISYVPIPCTVLAGRKMTQISLLFHFHPPGRHAVYIPKWLKFSRGAKMKKWCVLGHFDSRQYRASYGDIWYTKIITRKKSIRWNHFRFRIRPFPFPVCGFSRFSRLWYVRARKVIKGTPINRPRSIRWTYFQLPVWPFPFPVFGETGNGPITPERWQISI